LSVQLHGRCTPTVVCAANRERRSYPEPRGERGEKNPNMPLSASPSGEARAFADGQS